MREAIDAWTFVIAAYAVSVAGIVALIVWSLATMRRAERRRGAAREK